MYNNIGVAYMSKSKEFQRAVSRPEAGRSDAVVHLHGETIPNPYESLEDLNTSSTQAWVDAQEERYREYIGTPDSETKDSISTILDAPKKGIPTRAGDYYLFYYQAGEDAHPRVMISDTAEGVGRTLIDPHEFDPSDISSIVNVSISPDGKHVGYIIRKSPMEAELRIRNIETGEDLPDVVKNPGNGMKWDKDGGGFSYYVFPETNLGLVKHHVLGEDSAKDPIQHEGMDRVPFVGFDSNNPICHVFYQGSRDWLFTGEASGDPQKSLSLKDEDSGEYRKLFDAGVALFEPIADTEGGVLMLTTHNAPNGKVVLFDPGDASPESWKIIIPEEGNSKLKYIFRHRDKLIALYSGNQVKVFDERGKPLGDLPIPEQSSQIMFSHATRPGTALGAGASETDEEDLFISVIRAPQQEIVYRYNFDMDNLVPLDTPSDKEGLNDFIVETLWAESKDGTKVPISVIRKPGVELDGTAALKLGGYGGFGTSGGGDIDAETKDFIRSGGIYAYADVRGGGGAESDWHNGGRLLNKQNCFDDFIACAKHLIKLKYTSSPRLVTEGASNGGTLVLAAMQQEPTLFGAVFAHQPGADMLDRKMIAFKQEFGDPYANRDDYKNIKSYSPLHNIKAGQKYPPCMVRAGALDRLLVAGDLKFVATMQHESPESTVLLHVEKDYGHGVVRPKDVEIEEATCKRAFIVNSIGPIDQNEYKQELAARKRRAPGLVR